MTNKIRTPDPKAGMESVIDYSSLPRDLLEKKARMLDSLELHFAALFHGAVGPDEHFNQVLEILERADFKNYFNQDYFDESASS